MKQLFLYVARSVFGEVRGLEVVDYAGESWMEICIYFYLFFFFF